MYGEILHDELQRLVALGLSPHVRGNRSRHEPDCAAPRSIPACTGKPDILWKLAVGTKVYPRMYGETASTNGIREPLRGLSPHVRGNPQRSRAPWRPARSIPACTGKPGIPRRARGAGGVYPRMYGETVVSLPGVSATVGLSPHVRGNPWPSGRAYDISGLSPHVRGNPRRPHRRSSRRRSIPACTGKPRTIRSAASATQVYPRMYGETSIAAAVLQLCKGLSPHVRGNPRRPSAGAGRPGSIPACTGKPIASHRAPDAT